MEKKTVLIKDLSINFDLPPCNLANEVFTKAINFTCVNGKFVTTSMSAPAPVVSEKGPWAALPTGATATGATAIALSLLYHFDSYPFVEETGALITQGPNIPANFLTTGQTFGAGCLEGSYGSGHSSQGDGLVVVFQAGAPNSVMQPNFTFRFRYTPNTDTALSGWTGVLRVRGAIDVANQNNAGFYVFRDLPVAVLPSPMVAGTAYAISVEVYNDTGYFYVDGQLIRSYPNLTDTCYNAFPLPHPFEATLRISLGYTLNDVGIAPIYDEFLFVNGTALATGASSYTVETIPYTGVIYV